MQKLFRKPLRPKRVIMIFVGITVILICAVIALFNLDQTQKPILVILGDSNSDLQSQVQVEKWSQIYAQSHQGDVDVHNLAIGGHAVEDFIAPEIFQALTTIANHVEPNQPVYVVSLLGTNNAIMSNKLDNPDKFVRNYRILLTDVTAILKPKQILVGSIPPAIVRVIPGTKTPTDPGAPKLIPLLNTTLQQWILTDKSWGKTKLSFVNIMPTNSYEPSNISQYFIADGIHFNAKGQSTVYNLVTPVIDQMLKR